MILKSTIFSSIKSTKLTLLRTLIWHFLYTYLEINNSPMKVATEKGTERLSRLIPKFTTISGVTKERFDPISNNTYEKRQKTQITPMTTFGITLSLGKKV